MKLSEFIEIMKASAVEDTDPEVKFTMIHGDEEFTVSDEFQIAFITSSETIEIILDTETESL